MLTVRNGKAIIFVAADVLNHVQVFSIKEKTKESVLKILSKAAIAAGYAKEEYYQAILEREAKYPTGLHTPAIEVAIPHADAEWSNAPSLTIGLLEEPVPFEPMGGEGDTVQAEIVFMLTIKDPKEQIDFLRAFSTLMGDPQVLIDFKKTGDAQPLLACIKEKMR